MSTKRLVVLDEQDYLNLLENSKRLQQEVPPPVNKPYNEEPAPAEYIDEPKEPAEHTVAADTLSNKLPSPEPEPTPEPLSKVDQEPDPEVEAAQGPEPETKSKLQEVIEGLSRTIQQPALRLLKRLSKVDAFDFDGGQLTLDGDPVEGYSLKELLVATCTKGAPNDLPLRVRTFLWKNKILKFRNPKIVLKAKQPWRSFPGSRRSTTARVK